MLFFIYEALIICDIEVKIDRIVQNGCIVCGCILNTNHIVQRPLKIDPDNATKNKQQFYRPHI